MKLFIINGENNDEKMEIHIGKESIVTAIKDELVKTLYGNGNFTEEFFNLIYKNTILCDHPTIKHYKICENDEIWFGKIENYWRKDYIVVYVYIFSNMCTCECLIMEMNDKISTIRTIIERIYSKIINIWNVNGNQMKNDQSVSEITTNGNYKLIIKCDDGKGNKIYTTFSECCELHERRMVEVYMRDLQIRDDNKNNSRKAKLINLYYQIRQMILLHDTFDDRLNQNLFDLPSSFINSTNFFSKDMTIRIVDIFDYYWRSVENQYENDIVSLFYQDIHHGIFAALWDFSKIWFPQNNKKRKKPVYKYSYIIIAALRFYFEKYLIDSNNDWRYWLGLYMNRSSFRSFSDSDLNKWIDESAKNDIIIKIKINGENRNSFITPKPETIIEAKKSISTIHKVDMKHLYCIKPGGDHKLNDEDKFDDEFIFEIVLSMNDIEILGLLGEGGFGEAYRCLDKISNEQFVMKKPIRNGLDLYRDINIYSKLSSSRKIMNYSRLIRYGENICIGMKYMSGGSLRSYLGKEKHLSEPEIVKISYEILTQINELHKLGIIHRDIKSDNIVFDEHNNPYLIDFGLAKDTIGLTSKDQLDKLKVYKPGTYFYMAPELIKGEPYSDKIDIWSFGMVMVEMVTGKIPFHGLTLYRAVIQIRDCTKYEFKPIFPISNALNQFINSCLNTNPDKRPSAEHLIKLRIIY